MKNWLLIIPFLVSVPALSDAQTEQQRLGAHGLTLPASFVGKLPCADCADIDYHLDLWDDQQGYALRRIYQDHGDAESEMGRWHVDPARNALVLEGTGEARSQWQVLGDQEIRLLNQDGGPIESALPYNLVAGPLVPTALRLPVTGLVTYFADAALFTECLSGQRYPIAMEADYLALERAYLGAQVAPGAPLLARLDAEISMRPQMDGPDRMTVTVEQFHHVTPDGGCPDYTAPAALANTFWGLTHLAGRAVDTADGVQEPYLLVSPDATAFRATVGCNRIVGGLSKDGDTLEFGAAATTRMACPAELAENEAAFIAMLGGARRIDIADQTLRLLDADGGAVGQFRALYTRR